MRMPNRARWAVAGAAAVTVLGAVTGVILLTGGGDNPPARPAAAEGSLEQTTIASTVAPTTVASTTTTTPTSAAKTTTTTRKAPAKTTMPAPTPHPVDGPVPPPPHPAPVPGCAPSYTGDNAAKPDVKAALLSAAGKQYWATASNPPLEAVPPPDGTPPPPTETLGPRAVVTVPATLIEAIAWQESGWQSAIKACDGGVGTMQVMDATASWMNQRFGTSYTHTTLAGNTAIGAEYLEWLIAYFGENNFGHHYDITNQDLLTAVIVGYNAGAGAVQFADGHTVSSRYATTVKALMSSQPWG
jgi:soluble lytic murein transglycosylase-like protein